MLLNDRYQVHDRLGEGGMALVYRATDQRLGRQVAVKMLRPQYAGDAGFVERFEQEAQSAAGLSHPNIAAVYDTGQDGETRYIVMELLKPFTLHDLISRSRGGRLSPDDTVRYGTQIAAALAHAHARGVVHRDIKPHNILFTDDGLVKVTDFGIARALAATGGTATGTILGSPSYISPEQASGAVAGPPSDIYSLGVVLYEMLCGRPPYTGEQPVAIAVQHLNAVPQPLSERVDGVPPALERVVMKAMARRPEDRYQNADELRLALDAALTAPAYEPTTVMGAAARAAAGFTATAPPVAEGEPEPYVREVPPRRLSPLAIAGLAILVLLGVAIGILSAGRNPEPPPELPLTPEVDIEATKKIVVPSLVGQDVDRARQWVEEKYRLEQTTPPQLVEAERRDSHSPANEILEQSPAPGTTIDEGGVIRLVVSTGSVRVAVPDVTGMTLDRARELLQSEDLQLGNTDLAYSDRYVADVVMSQDPAPDSQVDQGTAVHVTVSQGKQEEPKPPTEPKPPANPPEEPGAPDVGLSIGQPHEVDGGLKQATVVVAVPTNSIPRAVELRWLDGGTGTVAAEVVQPGSMLKEDVRGVPGAVLGVFVDGSQKGQVEY